jgi:membrane protein DedA with SNARE-associated domain
MDNQFVLNFIQHYGYWVLYPMMIIEGPIVTLAAAGLSATGILNTWVVFLISVTGDLSMDIILYSIGFFGNNRLRKYIYKYPKLENRRMRIQHFFAKHGGKVVFLAKISTGLAYVTFLTAGMIRLPIRKFIMFTFIGGMVWSGLLVTLGYFYGHLYLQINDHIQQAGIITVLIVGITLILISLIKKWETKKIFDKPIP